jgi:hypothetical protein
MPRPWRAAVSVWRRGGADIVRPLTERYLIALMTFKTIQYRNET